MCSCEIRLHGQLFLNFHTFQKKKHFIFEIPLQLSPSYSFSMDDLPHLRLIFDEPYDDDPMFSVSQLPLYVFPYNLTSFSFQPPEKVFFHSLVLDVADFRCDCTWQRWRHGNLVQLDLISSLRHKDKTYTHSGLLSHCFVGARIYNVYSSSSLQFIKVHPVIFCFCHTFNTSLSLCCNFDAIFHALICDPHHADYKFLFSQQHVYLVRSYQT